MRRRIFAFFMVLTVVFSLPGCAKEEAGKSVDKEERKELKDTDVVFSYGDPSEYITIPDDYLGIEVSAPQKVTDAEVQQQIEYARYMHIQKEEIKEGVVKEGDTVHVINTGTLKGEMTPFESDAEYDITIGDGTMIAGYEEALIGRSVGDTVQIDLTFPKDYKNESLQGKEAAFKVTIDYIEGTVYLGEWTDEFVQKITNGDYKNTVDYETALRKDLQNEKDEEIYYTQQAEIIRYLVENSVVHKFPEGMVEQQYDSYLESYQEAYEEEGGEYSSFEEYILEVEGYASMDNFYDYLRESANNTAIELLVYQAVGYKEKVELTKVEYDNFLQTFASMQGYSTAEVFEEDFMKLYKDEDEDFLYKKFLNQKVLEYLQSKATAV